MSAPTGLFEYPYIDAYGLQLEESFRFAEWAFGREPWRAFLFEEICSLQLLEAWNNLHGEELMIHPLESVHESMKKMVKLWRQVMDKKMHQVTKRMKIAEKDVKKGQKKAAVKVLKKAERRNEKLVKIDRTVRDPMIKKCKKVMAKKGAKGSR